MAGGPQADRYGSRLMLLDQKRTKFWVRIFAVITSIAFVGGLIIFGFISIFLGGTDSPDSLHKDEIATARKEAQASPGSAEAWASLAQALLAPVPSTGVVDPTDAAASVDPARRAARLAPQQFDKVDLLVQALTVTGQNDKALAELQRYTAANPRDLDALLRLGDVAQTAGKEDLARLSYATVASRDPEGIQGQQAQAVLDKLNGTTTSTTGQTPTTTRTKTPTTTRTTTSPTKTATTPSSGPVTP